MFAPSTQPNFFLQQKTLGQKVEEADLLIAQNKDLEAKLTSSQEDSKRCSSGPKPALIAIVTVCGCYFIPLPVVYGWFNLKIIHILYPWEFGQSAGLTIKAFEMQLRFEDEEADEDVSALHTCSRGGQKVITNHTLLFIWQ
jgi:hypothetical protein